MIHSKTNIDSQIKLGWFHKYPARFSKSTLEEIFEIAVSRLKYPPMLMYDPFSGTGATLSLARQKGIPAIGKELTELGFLISQVRLRRHNQLHKLTDLACSYIDQYIKFDSEPETSIDGELVKWIGHENYYKVGYLRSRIAIEKDSNIKNALLLALSASLRPSSKWLVGSIKPQVDPKRNYSDLFSHFLKSISKIKTDCELEFSSFAKNCPAIIYKGNSSKTRIKANSVDLVITSPPYESMYDYYDVHRLSYLALDWPILDEALIGKKYNIILDGKDFSPPKQMEKWYYSIYGAENTVKGRALRQYFQKMKEHYQDVYRIVKKDGIVAYAAANSLRKSSEFMIVESLMELMKSVGFRDLEIIERQISNKRILPAGRNPKTGRFESNASSTLNEKIIIARK